MVVLMEKEYEVEVVYRQRAMYRLHADDRETAERLAAERWREGAPSDLPGCDWSELDAVRAEEAPEPERRQQDAEVVLRFLRERERLIQRLGGDLLNPSTNDAISAAQVASDLGWTRHRNGSAPGPDVVRATEALESLCASRKVICFERPRFRTGERGDIRLYCTPEYLELLSSELEGMQHQTA